MEPTVSAAPELNFRGWVPNLDGSISFSAFGNGQLRNSNVGDIQDRFVICARKRNLSDALFGISFKKEKVFHLVCVAETIGTSETGDSKLSGILCLIHKETWNNGIGRSIALAQDELDIHKCEFPQLKMQPYIRAAFADRFNGLVGLLRSSADFLCDFELPKTGVASIIAPLNWTWDKSCADAEEKAEQRFMLCSQLFYFLKDIGHRHQHHSPRTDTLSDLYPMGDDKRWKYEVFRRLYLKMMEYEWRKNELVYCSSLGILSYVRSFHRIEKGVLDEYKLMKDAIFPLKNMKLSIVASRQTISRITQARLTSSERFRNSLVMIAGFVFFFFELSQLITNGIITYSDVAPWVYHTDRFVLINPLTSFTIIGALIAILATIVNGRDLKMGASAGRITRTVQGFPRWAAIGLVIFSILAIFAFFSFVVPVWFLSLWNAGVVNVHSFDPRPLLEGSL